MTKKIYGILGYPVKHSLSPAMQNAAFRSLGMDAEYRLFETPPEGLSSFLENAAKNNISGLNITIPHKIRAKEYVELHGFLDENAKRLGAVNTVKISGDGKLYGHNTDGPGFYRSLVENLKFKPDGKSVFVLGAGGAAKAVVMYLGNGPKAITVFDVDRSKVEELKKHYSRYYDAKKFKAVESAGGIKNALTGCDLLVNATPIGMKEDDPSPALKEFLRPGLYVYDLVYNRPITKLVSEAKAAGACAVTGVGMLLYQGAEAFEIWTGMKAPLEVMKTALDKALSVGN